MSARTFQSQTTNRLTKRIIPLKTPTAGKYFSLQCFTISPISETAQLCWNVQTIHQLVRLIVIVFDEDEYGELAE
jgi:hypothetical protein